MTSSRSTHRSNAKRLALAALCALALTAATRSSSAQGRRGQLVVLGLRAPNGDDEAATNMTNALRRAARQAGFDVPDSSPALEQSMAAFGCDESVPADCLAQIAGDQHAQRLVYGEVRHHGRGAAAQLEINVTLYDNATHTSPAHDSATAPRSTGLDNDALSPMATRMLGTLLPAPAVVVTPIATPVGPTQPTPPVDHPPPGPPAPIRRIVGYTAVAVGVVGVGVGLLGFGLPWLLGNNALNDHTGLDGNVIPGMTSVDHHLQDAWLWQRYMSDSHNGGAVCASALAAGHVSVGTNLPSSNTAAATYPSNVVGAWEVNNAISYCQHSTSQQTGQWAFTVGGAVVAVLGVVLVVTDHTGAAPAASEAHARRRTAPTFALLPSLSPSYQGADVIIRF